MALPRKTSLQPGRDVSRSNRAREHKPAVVRRNLIEHMPVERKLGFTVPGCGPVPNPPGNLKVSGVEKAPLPALSRALAPTR
jgi:hypothetical protein